MAVLAVELALTDRIDDGSNGDFLRDDALLAIVMLTDEDDCLDLYGDLKDSQCHDDVGVSQALVEIVEQSCVRHFVGIGRERRW